MSRNNIIIQLISIDKQIKSIEHRELDACFASATNRPHEDLIELFIQKDYLVVEKLELKKMLRKPTVIQIIRGR